MKGFISNGHDEFWTQQMLDGLMEAVDEGLNVAFLSGNAVANQIQLEPSTDGRPNRVLTPRDALPSFKDEQDLLGSRSNGVGFGHWICRKPDHWVYEGTGMKEGDSIPYAIGWEFHGSGLSKIRKDLVVLASSKLVGNSDKDPVVDKVSRWKEHQGTIYTGGRGNIVFNAGSCWWSLGLSRPPGIVTHASAPAVDARMQRITQNVLDRITKSDFPLPYKAKEKQ